MNNSASASHSTGVKSDAPEWHRTVLSAETAELLCPAPGKIFLDGTLGGGGHSEVLLLAGARVVGLDRDTQSLAHAVERLSPSEDKFTPVHGNFAVASDLPAIQAAAPYDGAILDLGVSSHQLDVAERGFSFRHDGPLDMRMDPSCGDPVSLLVNSAEESKLIKIFQEYGEEPRARRVAQAIVAEREERAFASTAQLANLVEKVLGRRGRLHPATRVFQALRIAVNDELGALEKALAALPSLLRNGARLVIITFHSLEDRLVKKCFRLGSSQWLDRPEWPAPRLNPEWRFLDLTRKAIEPSRTEIAANPRARSARLRAVEVLSKSVEVAA